EDLWRSMVRLANARRRLDQPNRPCHRANNDQTRQPPTNRQRLERGRIGTNGLAALSCAVSVLCSGWRAKLPSVPAQRGFVPGRALQRRLVRFVHDDGGASLRFESGYLHPHFRRFAPVCESPRPGQIAAHALAARPAEIATQPGGEEYP